MISIISPIYNEERILSNNGALYQKLALKTELIFVDGGSSDRSIEIAKQYGKVLYSKKGRASQMNQGAYVAKGAILLFLHVDTVISLETLDSIERKVRENGFIGGCLTQRIDKKGFIYRLIEAQGNIRAKIFRVFYGDQGIFVKKDIFLRMGSFPEVPIMEDILFTKKLRKIGTTIVLPDKVFVSPRRWEKTGIIKTTLLYHLIILLFKFGVGLKRIRRLYDDLR